MPSPYFTRDIPRVGEPGKVVGLTIVVVVECQNCDSKEQVALVNAQRAVCESCGTVFNLDDVRWSAKDKLPHVALSASNPRAIPTA